MEGQITSKRLLEEIQEPLQDFHPTESQKLVLVQVINTLSNNLPEAFFKLKLQLLR